MSPTPDEPNRPDAELLARDRLELERDKFEAEKAARNRELAIREQEGQRSRKWDPLVVAILTAAAAAGGNIIVSAVNGYNERQIETLKAEQALVLEAIKTGGDTKKATDNLRFLASAELLSERGGRIKEVLGNVAAGGGPSLPATALGTSQKGLEVMSFQRCLETLNIKLPADGYSGPLTRARIRDFQKQNGLEVTGLINEATAAKVSERCNA